MERYIGLDAHQASCTFGVISERGRRLQSAVVETNGRALVEFLKTIPRRRHLCLEEGTQSGWLYEILSPHVDEIVVTHLHKESRGKKDDLSDAFARAEDLRIGSVNPVFKSAGKMGHLRSVVDVHEQVTRDRVRAQNRLKALYRSRGILVTGRQVYAEKHREQFVAQLPQEYRPAARLLHSHVDSLRIIKNDAKKEVVEASKKHAISQVLETCPGMGPIRVARFISTVVSPHRFRGARQLWAYSGLGVVMRSSSDWAKTSAGWQRVETQRTRGLNRNFNRRLKHVFKGAATAVIAHRMEPMYGLYTRALEQGTKPPMAKLTLARRIAATVLAMWKHQEVYDPNKRLIKR